MSKAILKTSKFHIESILFWPLIYLLWEPFSGKRSHWWNWSKYVGSLSNGVMVDGLKGYHNTNNLWHRLIEINFRWKKLVILKPKDYKGEYQIVYERDDCGKSTTEICSVVVDGKCACLLSPDDTMFYAISYPECREIELEIVGYTDKHNLSKEIVFL